MKKTCLILATVSNLALAQVMIPDGTPIRLRLEQNLSSETAELGQVVDLSVSEEVRVGDAVVIANGARATGSIIQVQAKRRMGRAGKLDFSIDRVMAVDGSWVPLRYVPNKAAGKNQATRTAIVAGTLGVAFGGPIGALGLLTKGQDITINRGRAFTVFADSSHYVSAAMAASSPQVGRVLPHAPAMPIRTGDGTLANNGGLSPQLIPASNPTLVSNAALLSAQAQQNLQASPQMAGSPATVKVNSNVASADIEVDGMFVGNAPTTIQLTPGAHTVTVRNGAQTWERTIQVSGGMVTLNANFGPTRVQASR